MSFGYQLQPRVMVGDSAVLTATLFQSDDSELVAQNDITRVTFTVMAPGDSAESPSIDQEEGNIIADGTGQFVVDPSINSGEGDYKAIATFNYNDAANGINGLTRSIPVDYQVTDPMLRVGPSPADAAVRQCWMFIEDCFDSEQGGPWLRDMTMAVFDQSKIRGFIGQALMTINNQMPFTNYVERDFPYTVGDGEALFALALLVQIERQLMRAYTEQPDVVSSPVAFMDRKRYQQAWQAMYNVDSKEFTHWVNRWKLRQYDLSSGALLIGSKAGRMMPAPMRSRNVGRGF